MLLMEAFKYFLTTINFRKIKVLFLYIKKIIYIPNTLLALEWISSFTDIACNISTRDTNPVMLQEHPVPEAFKYTGWSEWLLHVLSSVEHMSMIWKSIKSHKNIKTTKPSTLWIYRISKLNMLTHLEYIYIRCFVETALSVFLVVLRHYNTSLEPFQNPQNIPWSEYIHFVHCMC